MRGPPKTPTWKLKLAGSSLVAGRAGEPTPASGIPDKPDELSDRAANVWDQVTSLIDGMGVLTIADGNSLARYCELYGRWVDVASFLANHGETYTIYEKYHRDYILDEHGRKVISQIKRFPQTVVASDLANQLLRIEQQFGLTPSSRAGLRVPPKEDESSTGKKRFFAGA